MAVFDIDPDSEVDLLHRDGSRQKVAARMLRTRHTFAYRGRRYLVVLEGHRAGDYQPGWRVRGENGCWHSVLRADATNNIVLQPHKDVKDPFSKPDPDAKGFRPFTGDDSAGVLALLDLGP